MHARQLTRCSTLLSTSILLVVTTAWAGQPIDYLRDVKPILREKCFACHGARKQENGLRLDTAASVRRGGESGAAIDANKPQASLLIQRVTTADESERMPQQATALTAEQIALLQAWIEQGASAPSDEAPDRDPRDHWAFRVPSRAPIPLVKDSRWSRHPIDAFVAAEQEKRSLRARPAADKAILLRRVYLDLIGLPPTVDELNAFLADAAPNAYERVVERLLASPRYGERWGRHWMDVWRYADWYGRRHVPDVWNSAPQLWRWRDWIVRSLNQDKGYDRMLAEMLAADEIAPEDDNATVATGYLIRNWYALNPNDWMRQNVEHTAKAFLGLTFNCAHCHDHKYDPITQQDYFALRAFFEPIGIRQDRVVGEADPGPFQEYSYSVLRKIVRLGAVRIYDKTPDAPTWFYSGGDERNRQVEKGKIPPTVPAVLGGSLNIRPVEYSSARVYYPALRPEIQATVVSERRTAIQQRRSELEAARIAADQVIPAIRQQVERDYEDYAARRAMESQVFKIRALEAKLAAAEAELSSAECRIAADRAKYGESTGADSNQLSIAAHHAERSAAVKQAEASYIAGDRQLAEAEAKTTPDNERSKSIDSANKQIATALAALSAARTAQADSTKVSEYTAFSPVFPARSTGRRRALAEWLGNQQNPLTARVAINHIWMRHFHAPLVSSVFDFGQNGSPPTHPELLDWLAVEFMESGWSMAHIHRLILTSETYRMDSSQSDAVDNTRRDPENKFLWRQNVGRMEAEVVRDSLLACQEQLNLAMGGQELENEQALTTNRRSLYYSCQPELDGKSELGSLFDAPDALDCYRRSRSIIPQQALALSNSTLAHNASSAVADRIWSSLTPDQRTEPGPFAAAAFDRILSRRPFAHETAACADFLAAQNKKHGKPFGDDSKARASLIRVLLNHNDFVTIR